MEADEADGKLKELAALKEVKGLKELEELKELDTASEDEADVQTEIPTAVKVGDEPSGDEETSPGTVRTPAVQLRAEDPETDPSS